VTSLRRRLALVPLALVAGLAAVPVASAACTDQTYDTHFRDYKDNGLYWLIEGGDFDNGSPGWTFEGAVSVVRDEDGGEYEEDSGDTGDLALQLEPGASVLTPPVCVTDAHRSMRFYAYSGRRGHKGGKVEVQMLYVDDKGEDRSWKVGDAGGSEDWRPTKVLKLDAKRYGLKKSGEESTRVRFRITAKHTHETIRIDDVYIDPRLR